MSFAATFQHVSKIYQTHWFKRTGISAVQDISLSVPRGQVMGLLGPNRAGKTTLVKMLLSLCRATQGQITRLGKPVSDASTLGAIGYMHENQHFPRYLNATQLLSYYGSLTGVDREKLPVRVHELLERVGLGDRKREPISRFSKGMVQRLGLAQALLNQPELLVLDEPSEGLDLPGRQLLRTLIAEQKQRGATVILVSHVMVEVEKICDHVAVISGGKLLKQEAMSSLLRDPKTGQTRTLEQAVQPLFEKAPL